MAYCNAGYKIVFSAAAMNLIGHLDLYIPTHNERDVQNKYSIIRTDSKFHASKKSKSKAPSDDEDKRWKRYERVYQCQCGVDHTQGRFAASENKRQIPWKNVGCLSYIRLITMHDELNSEPFSCFLAVYYIINSFL